jgi:ABC-2 type transport system permease protein
MAAMIGVSSVGVLIAKTETQAAAVSSVLVFGLAILGGNFVPLSHEPPLLALAARLTPNGWALNGFANLATAVTHPLHSVALDLAVLAGFAVACGTLALLVAGRLVRNLHA